MSSSATPILGANAHLSRAVSSHWFSRALLQAVEKDSPANGTSSTITELMSGS